MRKAERLADPAVNPQPRPFPGRSVQPHADESDIALALRLPSPKAKRLHLPAPRQACIALALRWALPP
eukprot:15474452-Alexandrium_andersonii.AAC.1